MNGHSYRTLILFLKSEHVIFFHTQKYKGRGEGDFENYILDVHISDP